MKSQKSFQPQDVGTLFIIPTPIGNLEDMTPRAIRLLKEVTVIAAEDTRNTKKLCHVFEIQTPLTSYHEHNKEESGRYLVERLLRGEDVALVSDAGMPAISDPGYELVQQAIEESISVVPIPGANAALTALVGSGLVPQPFTFYGFLPRGKKDRISVLEKWKNHEASIIFYEAPHRLNEMLMAIHTVWGNRSAVLCRELTKRYEEYIRGTLEELVEWSKNEQIRGEFVVIVEGNSNPETIEETPWWEELTINEHVDNIMKESGITSKEAIKEVAKQRSLSKREVYQSYHVH
ncbi:16S rRNA (cytidine(1402)-2'-O)-methyltransferase [Mangrovibacillus cuniculi]|uniref:Ribosomal RNA small subunit methyltransferase I n=1 Tax=Mangrovibacillus cuniculi TaxID=2593652 RepID=A0A7S8HGI9_9BACI|nr:16S rRNA (cytidine(1402)-2'-O)-methyltransferase [Mangrovibacillus cuniculi]QPC47963.1 16S rRNA (cytidine(1402)-2'-O)-methyltransferase [Mangrovibacillus cuniculi]